MQPLLVLPHKQQWCTTDVLPGLLGAHIAACMVEAVGESVSQICISRSLGDSRCTHACLVAALDRGAAGILSALSCSSLDQLSELLGAEGSQALSDLQQLWRLAEGYGYADWLVFDASVVRGLAYYTGKGQRYNGLRLYRRVRARPSQCL